MSIHREGYFTLILALIFTLILQLTIIYLGLHSWLRFLLYFFNLGLFVFLLQFFRNPSRITPLNENHIISPADGKVVVIEQTIENEYFKEPRLQISIFMSPLNVHVNRNPVSGQIAYFKYHPGKYLVAWHPKSSTENERTTLVYKLPNQTEILVRQIAGAVARRICWYVKPEQLVKQGDEFGFIKFGSRVDIFLPLTAQIKIKLNDKVRGGETILATI
jgi:phosphatidylserine decarboxylase